MAIILHYFTQFGTFGANYITVVEVKPVLSGTEILPKETSFQLCMTYVFSILPEMTGKACVKES